jgi:hypothetical protein
MNNRPGRPRALIAPLSDPPEATMTAILERIETLLERVPLTEKAALGFEEAAAYLSISVETVKALQSQGYLVPLDMPFKRTLFLKADLDAFLASRKVA